MGTTSRSQGQVLQKHDGGSSVSADEPDQQSVTSTPDGQGTLLKFVMVTKPMLPPDRQHREAVRRHVMCAVHTRRRAKNRLPVRQHKLLQKLAPGTSSESLPSFDTSSSTASHPENTNEDYNRPHNNRYFKHCQSLDLMLGRSSSSNPPLSRPYDGFSQWIFAASSPYALLQSEGAPFLCMKPHGWPFPVPLGNRNPKLSVWMPTRNIPPPNWNAARGCMHRSAQFLPYIQNSCEYFAFKVETIKWINTRLENVSLGTNDATIGSILLLINFEIARGNLAECVQHIDGLHKIVNLRGGVRNFERNRHFLVKLLLLDLIVAIMGNTQPRFSSSILPTLLPSNMLGERPDIFPDSPLLSSTRLRDILEGSSFCDKSIRILEAMQDLTNFSITGDQSPVSAQVPHLLDLDTTHLPPQSLLRIIHLTALIYSSAFQTPLIFFLPSRPLTEELCQALESPVNDWTWARFPGIFVWILLVAASAAEPGSNEYTFFVSLLVKVGLSAGFGWFEELREAIQKFMSVKTRRRGL